MKKLLAFLFVLTLGLTACSSKESANEISIGTIAGPETQLMAVAKKVALEKYGLEVKIVTFSDYNTPNAAVNDGSLNANAFQHLPYLQAQNAARGYQLVPVAKTFVYPMGIYSHKIKQLSQLKAGAKVAIPQDPSNEARALLLLQKAGLITLRANTSVNATTLDILKNPKKLQFIALNAAQLPRSLSDVTIAAINTNFAVPAGLSPNQALFLEGPDSLYANLIVVRADEVDAPKVKKLVAAFQSEAVVKAAQKIFGADAAIPAFNVKSGKN